VSICALALLPCACATSTRPAPAPAVSTAPAAPAIDPEAEKKWQAFLHAGSRYYQLDKQDFTSVTCKVSSPLADNLVQQIRNIMVQLGDSITVTDTLDSYRATYSRSGGLHFDDPTLDIVVKPGAKVADQAKIDDGRAKIRQGFATLIKSLDTQVGLVVETLESAKRGAYDIYYVNETDGGYTLSYKDTRNGAQITGEQSGHQLKLKVTAVSGGVVDYSMDFDSMPDGKLLMRTLTEDAQQQQLMKSHSVMNLEYQSVGGITFPQHLSTHASIDQFQTSHQDVTMEIGLQNCTLKK